MIYISPLLRKVGCFSATPWGWVLSAATEHHATATHQPPGILAQPAAQPGSYMLIELHAHMRTQQNKDLVAFGCVFWGVWW